MIQTINTFVAEPTSRDMSLATRNTACPIIDPMTIAVAAHKPRPRIRPDELVPWFAFLFISSNCFFCCDQTIGQQINSGSPIYSIDRVCGECLSRCADSQAV